MKSEIHNLTDKVNASLKTPLEKDTFAYYKKLPEQVMMVFLTMAFLHNDQKSEFVELYDAIDLNENE